MTEIASVLTRVAAIPALYASKRSPARCLNNPSAICERAELWVHRNRTLVFAPVLSLAFTISCKSTCFLSKYVPSSMLRWDRALLCAAVDAGPLAGGGAPEGYGNRGFGLLRACC